MTAIYKILQKKPHAKKSAAYKAGMRSRRELGLRLDQNPYVRGSENYALWSAGWRQWNYNLNKKMIKETGKFLSCGKTF